MGKRALIVWGGYEGHQPKQVAELFRSMLMEEQFDVEVSDTLEAFADPEKLNKLDLIVPIWTAGQIERKWVEHVSAAIASGVGLAGCHGGMCDAFRNNVLWQFITGGQWVAHPGEDQVEYVVNIRHSSSTLLEGIEDFTVRSEQYYLHVDPALEVLATTRFPIAPGPYTTNKSVDMPVVWTKRWGAGRVFYSSLGHQVEVLKMPQTNLIMRRGFRWAAEGSAAPKNLIGKDDYRE